ncbi:MAG: polysaccharide biosynthesis protein [Vicinamibacterales bacterium]
MIEWNRETEAHLLGRQAREVLTSADRRALAGRRLLVTGAGGSVGSELSRQIAACRPAHLTLIDHSEYALFRIERELRRVYPDVSIAAVLGDVTRRADVRGAIDATRPHVVYHAAAYKHVAMTETNLVPAARVNVLGTFEVARAARDAGARFVLVSSDKAAEPRSVMGASKRLAELAALALSTPSFRPVVVRFGNILGSSGSVIEIMLESVQTGRSIPITDPDATRFFMTATEAASLVLKSELLGLRTDVFWLDMGAPVRIGDLVERMVELAATRGLPRVGIDVIGLRPGEKVREELTTQALAMEPTNHERIWSARQRYIPKAMVNATLRELRGACSRGDAARVLAALTAVVADFVPSPAAQASAAGQSARDVQSGLSLRVRTA